MYTPYTRTSDSSGYDKIQDLYIFGYCMIDPFSRTRTNAGISDNSVYLPGFVTDKYNRRA